MQATIEEILKQTTKRAKLGSPQGSSNSPLNSQLSNSSSYDVRVQNQSENKQQFVSVDDPHFVSRKRPLELSHQFQSGACRINVSQIHTQTLAQQIQAQVTPISDKLLKSFHSDKLTTSYEISPGACIQLSLPSSTTTLNLPTFNNTSDINPPLPLQKVWTWNLGWKFLNTCKTEKNEKTKKTKITPRNNLRFILKLFFYYHT